MEMIKEKTSNIEEKFGKIVSDRSRNSFWKEKRKFVQNNRQESLVIKNDRGQRQFSPESIKEEYARLT